MDNRILNEDNIDALLLIAITILAYAQDVKMPILEISLAPDTRFYRDMPYTNGTMKLTDTEGKVIGQFCCNNGRELLSLVKCGKAAKGVGFDIAENQVAFANEKAKELGLPCEFEAANIYDIDDKYTEQFDLILITIGALCWFNDLDRFFAVAAKCMKPGGQIIINEQHPCTSMLTTPGEELYDPEHRLECHYSYFEHEWTGNGGMYYLTLKSYQSKTFTDYTHPMSEIISGMLTKSSVPSFVFS